MGRKALKMHRIFSVARMWETARCFKDALQDIFADDLHAFEDASQDILADDLHTFKDTSQDILADDLHAFKDASQDILADDLDGEEDEYDEDRRANDFHAVFHHEAGADVVTDHIADGAWDADQEDGLAVQDEDHEGGDVRRQIDDLRLAVGGFDTELREDGEGDDEEGAGAWAVEAIIEADDERGEDGSHVHFWGVRLRFFDIVVEDVAVQDDEGGHGQDDEEDRDEDLLRDEEADPSTDRGSDDGGDDGRNGELPVDEAFADETNGRDGGATAAGKLVGTDGVMRREAGEQIGRKGNQTATSADGVDETGEKYKRTADKIGQKCDVHSGGTSVCGGYGRRGGRRAAGAADGGRGKHGERDGRSRRSHSCFGRLHWRSRACLNNDVHVILFSSQAQALK